MMQLSKPIPVQDGWLSHFNIHYLTEDKQLSDWFPNTGKKPTSPTSHTNFLDQMFLWLANPKKTCILAKTSYLYRSPISAPFSADLYNFKPCNLQPDYRAHYSFVVLSSNEPIGILSQENTFTLRASTTKARWFSLMPFCNYRHICC